ncbi:hypothetical protein RFI_27305 [Reticulomyxa filosa]|uniref:Uncharacterized protein n=1 Tax=Reticulomyxa filosa TaxID=46433 RepID=X6M7W4_RETFI|nr:hypothetical protein RFI_27305 [Reticulomyxa filosa]|eukprot:ETO10073.1 hypothetical protein RFI_27305 [Reticulomyxa filosa]
MSDNVERNRSLRYMNHLPKIFDKLTESEEEVKEAALIDNGSQRKLLAQPMGHYPNNTDTSATTTITTATGAATNTTAIATTTTTTTTTATNPTITNINTNTTNHKTNATINVANATTNCNNKNNSFFISSSNDHENSARLNLFADIASTAFAGHVVENSDTNFSCDDTDANMSHGNSIRSIQTTSEVLNDRNMLFQFDTSTLSESKLKQDHCAHAAGHGPPSLNHRPPQVARNFV